MQDTSKKGSLKTETVEELKMDININVYEIGSRGGAFDDLKKIEHIINYTGFEPNPDECLRLNKNSQSSKRFLNERYFQNAIGGMKPRENLYVTCQPGCSSFLKPNKNLLSFYGRESWFKVVEEIKAETITLKDFCLSNDLSSPDFLKIDVEGMELEIIEGMDSLFDEVLGIRLEVNYLNHRIQQPKFGEIISVLENRGFRIFQFLENHSWRPDSLMGDQYPAKNFIKFSRGALAHGDVLLFRCPVSVSGDSNFSKERLLKMVLLLQAYGFVSHANALLSSEKLARYRINIMGTVLDQRWIRDSARYYLNFSIFTYLKNKLLFIKTFIKTALDKK
jgi:FkbM family methyltransferase